MTYASVITKKAGFEFFESMRLLNPKSHYLFLRRILNHADSPLSDVISVFPI